MNTPKRNILSHILILGFFLAACAAQNPTVGDAPSAEIVEPSEGSRFYAGDIVFFVTELAHPQGSNQAVLFANGQVIRTDNLATTLYLGRMQQGWIAQSPGTYEIQVLFSSLEGQEIASNVISILVEEPEPTPIEEASETPVETATPSFTPSPIPPVATANVDTNCRLGPASAYQSVAVFPAGQSAPIVGRLADSSYWVINPEDSSTNCWVWDNLVTVTGDTSGVPVVNPPALPTNTPTTEPLSAPAPISPSGTLSCASASSGVTLSWSAVSHPNGIDYYEWVLEGPINDSGTTSNLQANTVSLSCAGANYQWRVRVIDDQGNVGPWSNYLSFNVP